MGAMGPKWEPKGSQEGSRKATEAPDIKKSPKWSQNDPKSHQHDLKKVLTWSQNELKMALKSHCFRFAFALLSDVGLRTSDVGRRPSNIGRRTSDVERRTSDVERRTSDAFAVRTNILGESPGRTFTNAICDISLMYFRAQLFHQRCAQNTLWVAGRFPRRAAAVLPLCGLNTAAALLAGCLAVLRFN